MLYPLAAVYQVIQRHMEPVWAVTAARLTKGPKTNFVLSMSLEIYLTLCTHQVFVFYF